MKELLEKFNESYKKGVGYISEYKKHFDLIQNANNESEKLIQLLLLTELTLEIQIENSTMHSIILQSVEFCAKLKNEDEKNKSSEELQKALKEFGTLDGIINFIESMTKCSDKYTDFCGDCVNLPEASPIQ